MAENTRAGERRAEYVRALQEEREGYVRAGKADRVAQVDEQLAVYGEKPSRQQVTRATAKKPKA